MYSILTMMILQQMNCPPFTKCRRLTQWCLITFFLVSLNLRTGQLQIQVEDAVSEWRHSLHAEVMQHYRGCCIVSTLHRVLCYWKEAVLTESTGKTEKQKIYQQTTIVAAHIFVIHHVNNSCLNCWQIFQMWFRVTILSELFSHQIDCCSCVESEAAEQKMNS